MTTHAQRGRPADWWSGMPRMPRAGKSLTHRERVVLELVAEGLTNDQICRQLDYAPGTVSTMMQRILRKLDAPSRAAAVDRGWRLGYLGGSNVRSKGRVIR